MLGVVLSCKRHGPTRAIRGAQSFYGKPEIEAQLAVAIEQTALRLLDTQHLELGAHATIGRKTTGLAARRQHAMTRHDDRERVLAECLPDCARRTWRPDARRDLAIRQRCARRDRARQLVHASMKSRHERHIQGDLREIAGLAAQQLDDLVDRTLYRRRRRALVHFGIAQDHSPSRRAGASFRQVHAADEAGAPCDAATTNGRVEQSKSSCGHVLLPG